jgi:hypothetical protein
LQDDGFTVKLRRFVTVPDGLNRNGDRRDITFAPDIVPGHHRAIGNMIVRFG